MDIKKTIFIIVGLFLFLPNILFAHTVEQKNSFTALLHIEPNDSPQAGKEAKIILEINSQNNSFNFELCNCVLKIIYDNQTIATPDLVSTSSSNLQASFIFPQAGSYQLSFEAEPKNTNDFEKFELSYPITVQLKSEPSKQQSFQEFALAHGLHIFLFGGAFVFVYAWYLKDLYVQKRAKKQLEK